MILKITFFTCLLILAAGRPQSAGQTTLAGVHPTSATPNQNKSDVSIVKSDFVDDGNGSFRWEFETSDGSRAEQTGHTVNPGTENEGEVIQGSYSYKTPDGQVIMVSYIADENGFQPKGDHLPTPPPNPHSKNSTTAAAPLGASGPASNSTTASATTNSTV